MPLILIFVIAEFRLEEFPECVCCHAWEYSAECNIREEDVVLHIVKRVVLVFLAVGSRLPVGELLVRNRLVARSVGEVECIRNVVEVSVCKEVDAVFNLAHGRVQLDRTWDECYDIVIVVVAGNRREGYFAVVEQQVVAFVKSFIANFVVEAEVMFFWIAIVLVCVGVEIIELDCFFDLVSYRINKIVFGVSNSVISEICGPFKTFNRDVPDSGVVEFVVGEVLLISICNLEELGEVHDELGAVRECDGNTGVQRFAVVFQ